MKRFIIILIMLDIFALSVCAYYGSIINSILFGVLLVGNIVQLVVEIQLDNLEKHIR